MQFVTAKDATRESVEAALDAAFSKAFGIEMESVDVEPVVSEAKARLSPLMQRLVAVMEDGKWHKVEELGRSCGVAMNSIYPAIRNQNARLELIGKTIKHSRLGFRLADLK